MSALYRIYHLPIFYITFLYPNEKVILSLSANKNEWIPRKNLSNPKQIDIGNIFKMIYHEIRSQLLCQTIDPVVENQLIYGSKFVPSTIAIEACQRQLQRHLMERILQFFSMLPCTEH